ncbi:hypothetical protein HIM_07333 [Hirsutella minnesotensis 3608]|uniref:non-specific serine/threonine protein kinase n=1 Tax=Hirsutella minnesotensis 3608 TaxID=1043627 RepID=A0A0F8A4C3_9HYPO|nr:hypothetical protein HIM_07333 [Hirsutella minnesotensis 3608]
MSSSDEGEIRDDGHGNLKASHQQSRAVTGIDRPGRLRNSSPTFDDASRTSNSSRRSRSPRGYKRSRDADHYGRDRDSKLHARRDERPGNGRRFGGRDRDARLNDSYHDDRARRDEHRRARISYEDLDRPSSRSSEPPTPDRHYTGDRSDRNSRRDHDRAENRFKDYGRERDRGPAGDGRRNQDRRDGRAEGAKSGRNGYDKSSTPASRHEQKPDKKANYSKRVEFEPEQTTFHADGTKGDKEPISSAPAKEPSPEPDIDMAEPFDEEAEIARRRKRREEIMAKWASPTPLLQSAVTNNATLVASHLNGTDPEARQQSSEASEPPAPESGKTAAPAGSPMVLDSPAWGSPSTPAQEGASPADTQVLGHDSLMNKRGSTAEDENDGPSAADYDPSMDMEEDGRRQERRLGQTILHGEAQPITSDDQASEGNEDTKNGRDTDDSGFDMFAEEFDEEAYAAKQAKRAKQVKADGQKGSILEGQDKEGYYKVRIGEVLDGRYEVKSTLGQGVFARVAQALDAETGKIVAIKIMRNNYALRRGGYKEIKILEKLNNDDVAGKKHIIKLERSFEHGGHLCMVFEGMEMNLRDVLRKFGHNVGINLEATRKFARQIFIALDHMRKNDIIHADLKPDNILINDTRQIVKICDLGTAIDRSDAATAHSQVMPYLISRFYRAPEVILGSHFDYGIDMWSIGCTLFELFTGKILFPGSSNNQMLKIIMETRGRMHPKLYKRGELWNMHFDDKDNFISIETNKATNRDVSRVTVIKPTRNIGSFLDKAGAGMTMEEKKDLDDFRNLLDGCLMLHPERRITPSQALQHPFVKKVLSSKH